MTYKSLRDCVQDLERHNQLVRISSEVDPMLEMAEIHRRVFEAGGPAVYYENVKGSPFPAVSNLFGTWDRTQFIFRKTLPTLKKIFQLKGNPKLGFQKPWQYLDLPSLGLAALPKKVSNGPVLEGVTTISQLPQIQCWPEDGGAFVLLPQVYTEDCDRPGPWGSNLGMYRIQLSGNDYEKDQEIGLHYQIRRDIGIHHQKALEKGEPLKVSVFVGGPPGHTFSAVMYLPENLPEVAFAGALAGRRFRFAIRDGFVVSTDADFCITGTVDPNATKPEGPFGDHIGYYSLQHPFPFMKVHKVYHRKDAIWPFTVVGRPPQEDSQLGRLVQEIAGPVISTEIPGIKAVHAVDASGVHPLLLAIGSERFTPYEKRKPQELLKLSHALLGYGPCSLAKYLLMVSAEDDPSLDIHNIPDYLKHLLERVDWRKDLHFETQTTIDTLDYSGEGLNQGSKVVIAAAGEKRCELTTSLPEGFSLPSQFTNPQFVLPGILMIQGDKYQDRSQAQREVKEVNDRLQSLTMELKGIPLIIIVDDSDFTSQSVENFLWVTFTRSNPSHDINGVGEFTEFKHWGCKGPLIIDARLKPHHALPLEVDSKTKEKVDALAASNGPLKGII